MDATKRGIVPLMNYALQGELSKGILPNLLQYLAQSVMTGCLVLRHPDSSQGYIFYKMGKLVHISLGTPAQGKLPQKDVTALAVLLAWDTGRFQFRQAVAAPVETLSAALSSLLMQAAQLSDEETQNTGELLHERSVLRPVWPQQNESLYIDALALDLLSYLDGIHSLSEIAEAHTLPLNATIATAQQLYAQGLLKPGAQLLEPQLIVEFKSLLTTLVGPMGQIIVEDALLELNLSEDAVPERAFGELVELLRAELRKPAWRADFERGLARLCQRYGVAL